MRYKIVTQPTSEPITLDEARQHLRIEPFGSPLEHPDDTYISTLITIARQFCEEYTERAYAIYTIEIALDYFPPNEIELPIYPSSSIESVKYVDTAGDEQTVSPTVYYVDDYSKPNYLMLKLNQSWPETSGAANNVKIRNVVGSASELVPAPVKQAMLLLIGNFYENRQQDVLGNTRISFNSLPLGVYSLLQPYRLNIGL